METTYLLWAILRITNFPLLCSLKLCVSAYACCLLSYKEPDSVFWIISLLVLGAAVKLPQGLLQAEWVVLLSLSSQGLFYSAQLCWWPLLWTCSCLSVVGFFSVLEEWDRMQNFKFKKDLNIGKVLNKSQYCSQSETVQQLNWEHFPLPVDV